MRIMVQSRYKCYSWKGCKFPLVPVCLHDRVYCAQSVSKFPSTVTQFFKWLYHYWKLMQALCSLQSCKIWGPHCCADVESHLLGYDHVHRLSRPRPSTFEDETSGLSCSITTVANYQSTVWTSHNSKDFNWQSLKCHILHEICY